ncbi:hypothetical protein Cgig2_002886 [Carnegiea gigantea]|uniref:Uncharacterized protein n=1 Tax=Carnegiea gigantea TaxID=171969 RepID=A0A9Q1KPU5_9CARY|nr:hypothetical protein Cgig2_002886 [Carnegiea gigantea]
MIIIMIIQLLLLMVMIILLSLSWRSSNTVSLSICLVHFYPLGGRLATQKFPDDHASLIFVDCTKGPGARILHASPDISASDLLSPTGHVSPAVRCLFDLSEVKVTELLDGIFIGFTMSHSVADGTSFLHFVSALSEVFLTRSDTMIKKPILKPFFPDVHGPTLKLRYLDPEEFVTRLDPGPLRERIFHFSQASMAALKAKANEECGPDEKSNCTFAINSRLRFGPPFSEDYFGNFVSGAQISCTVGELFGHNLGWPAMTVYKHLAAQDYKAVRWFVEMCVKASFVAKPSSKPNRVLIGWSTKFDIPLAVLSGYGNIFDGNVTVNQGREGEGSVDLQIRLRSETMSALESDEKLMSYVCY